MQGKSVHFFRVLQVGNLNQKSNNWGAQQITAKSLKTPTTTISLIVGCLSMLSKI